MYRQLVRSTGALSLTQPTTVPTQLTRPRSSSTKNPNQMVSADVTSVREWLASFNNNVEAIPSSILKTRHDRSGWGMQRLASRNLLGGTFVLRDGGFRSYAKTICRAPIDALKQHNIPQPLLEKIKESPHYIRGSDAIETISEKKGSTSASIQDCREKIYDIIREKAKDIITECSREPPTRSV